MGNNEIWTLMWDTFGLPYNCVFLDLYLVMEILRCVDPLNDNLTSNFFIFADLTRLGSFFKIIYLYLKFTWFFFNYMGKSKFTHFTGVKSIKTNNTSSLLVLYMFKSYVVVLSILYAYFAQSCIHAYLIYVHIV